MKICSKCKQEKSLESFTECKSRKDGKYPSCKQCRKAYREANKREINLKNLEYKSSKREELAQKQREYYHTNKDRCYTTHQRWANSNPDKMRDYRRKWFLNNKAKWKVYSAIRRARKLNAEGTFTSEQWQARSEYYGNKCVYCGTVEDLQIEHRIPLSRGGTNWPANLVPACGTCNRKKCTKTELEFAQ